MISLKDFKLLLKTYNLGSSSDKKYLNKCIIFIVFSGISDGLFLLFGTNFIINLLTGNYNSNLIGTYFPILENLPPVLPFLIIVGANLYLRQKSTKMIPFASARIINTISIKILSNSLSQDIEFADQDKSSSKISSIALQTDLAGTSVISPSLRALAAIFSTILIFISMCLIDIKTTLISLTLLITCYFSIFNYYKPKLNKISERFVKQKAKLINALQECYLGSRYIRIYDTADLEINYVRNIDKELRQNHARQEYIGMLPRIQIESLIFFFLGSFGIYRSFQGFTATNFTDSFITLGIGGLKILPMLQQIYHGIHSFTSFKKSLEEVVSRASENNTNKLKIKSYKDIKKVTEILNPKKDFKDISKIELKKVSYSRSNNQIVFQDINHTFEKGFINLIKGASGKGKTTLLDITSAIRQPTNGDILINDKYLCREGKIVDFEIWEKWKKSLGFAGQRPYIKDVSVMDNIYYGSEKINDIDIDIEEILYFSCLDKTCGYEKSWLKRRCGENGSLISGGQALRIGLARAMLYSKNIIILDEPTSGLDSITQNLFFERITELSQKKLIIMTIHREDTSISKSTLLEI